MFTQGLIEPVLSPNSMIARYHLVQTQYGLSPSGGSKNFRKGDVVPVR